MKPHLLLIGLLTLVLSSCSKDEEPTFPNVTWMLADIVTDQSGKAIRLITDNMQSYTLANGSLIDQRLKAAGLNITNDTIIRINCTCNLTPESDQKEGITIYDAAPAFAPIPVSAERFKKGVKTDPIYLQSIWKVPNYINLRIQPMIRDKQPAFHFAYTGIRTSNSINVLLLTLHHDQGDDYPAFKQTMTLSIPIWPFAQILHRNTDSIEVTINTFDKGVIRKRFLY